VYSMTLGFSDFSKSISVLPGINPSSMLGGLNTQLTNDQNGGRRKRKTRRSSHKKRRSTNKRKSKR